MDNKQSVMGQCASGSISFCCFGLCDYAKFEYGLTLVMMLQCHYVIVCAQPADMLL